MKKLKRVLYCGDSPLGGPANYLLSILKTLPVHYAHIPPSKELKPRFVDQCDALILSDYVRAKVSVKTENRILSLLEERKGGLLMVGGWGSFTGLDAGWKGSEIEKTLPVDCLSRDDRRNDWTGLLVNAERKHAVLSGLPHFNYPVICGLNEVELKKDAELVLSARLLKNAKGRIGFSNSKYPLLAFSKKYRTAALMTDLAPHWCGGWVDWGPKRVALPVNDHIRVEIGIHYMRFVQNLIQWISR